MAGEGCDKTEKNMEDSSRNYRSVLVVEDNAHQAFGHFPNRFSELADGFHECDIYVEVLTAFGWAFQRDFVKPWIVRKYTLFARLLVSFSAWLLSRKRFILRPLQKIVAFALQVMAVCQARKVAAKLPQPCLLVMLNHQQIPQVVEIFSGNCSWIVHSFRVFRNYPILNFLASFKKNTPKITIAVPVEKWCEEVPRCYASTKVMALPLAGVRSIEAGYRQVKEPGYESFGQMRKKALLFGCGHSEQDPETVLEAFKKITDWQLIIAGRSADRFVECGLRDFRVPPRLIPGFLSEAERCAAFLDCDCVILSFVSPYHRNSGTLMDALVYRKPIVVSSGSFAASIAENHRIGTSFQAGNAADLTDVIKSFNPGQFSEAIDEAADLFSNKNIALRHLKVAADSLV